jgi:NitT/TauT family transport system substrate-binding protein/putative hydroxymethylpyrimidine transport system substrate-binding protein
MIISRITRRAALALALATCAAVAPLAGGAAPSLPQPRDATLILDFVPNAVHVGIFRAVAAGYYKKANINLRIIQPTSTSDTLKLIDAGKADFGIADGIDVANQIDQGRDAKAIMALVQRPLGGLIALRSEGITSPKQFEGKIVGITGVPSDTAIYKTIVSSAGGDPAKVKVAQIGFNGVQNLENGKISAFTGFWPADGVQVQVDGKPTRIFKLDENGGPRYPGLVVFSTQKRIASDGPLMRAFVAATVHGYRDTLANPNRSLNDFLRLNKSAQRKITAAQLKAYVPLFKGTAKRYGLLTSRDLTKLSAYLVRNKLIAHSISAGRYGTNAFVP